jgi:general secretion pathway protein C
MQPNQQIQLAKNSSWPPKIVSIIIAMLMAWWTYASVLPLFSEKEIVTEPTANITKAQTPKKVSLNKLDLFGKTEQNINAKKTNEAIPTKLNLTLRGILATNDPTQGIAQIQNANKEEKEFVVNDSIFGQATLKEIYRDRVIILHNGKYETLLLPEEFLNIKHYENAKLKQERKKALTDLRALFLNSDIDQLLKLFEFDTAWKNGGFAGFIIRVLGEKGIELLATLGLEEGDLITVLNGLRFSESLEASQQLKELKYQTSVDIIIERNGQEIPFHFSVDEAVVEQMVLEEEAEIEREKNSTKYKNTIDADGKVDRSGFTQSLIDSRDEEDEDLEPDWDEGSDAEKAEAEAFITKQRARSTGSRAPVKFDH